MRASDFERMLQTDHPEHGVRVVRLRYPAVDLIATNLLLIIGADESGAEIANSVMNVRVIAKALVNLFEQFIDRVAWSSEIDQRARNSKADTGRTLAGRIHFSNERDSTLRDYRHACRIVDHSREL